jgi:ligand-binding SRPBCC domain-containing protein
MVKFSTHSGIHTLHVTQRLPISLENAWEFFSTPGNLAKITPEHMGFMITSKHESEKMYPGQIITYKVYPFKGVSTNWVTEITHVIDQEYFVDEQRFGPYSMWHHEHRFKAIKGGVTMTDRVSYKVPLGILGRIMERLLIRRQLRTIFNYRYEKLIEFFGPFENENNREEKDLTVSSG